MSSKSLVRAALAAGIALPALATFAAPISQGLYQLRNHPDGNQNPPLYGLRLDELVNATSGHDVFTFDFNHASSNMQMTYNGTTIHIFGQAYGGRDIGASYANDASLGIYLIDFTYNIGVAPVPGDDDIYVNPGNSYNYGSITRPGGQVISMRDGHYGNGQPDFRFGDEDNDLGHRGFAGLSGWGWLFTNTGPNGSYVNYTSNDWLFTANLVPGPGAAALLGLGALATGRRRR